MAFTYVESNHELFSYMGNDKTVSREFIVDRIKKDMLWLKEWRIQDVTIESKEYYSLLGFGHDKIKQEIHFLNLVISHDYKPTRNHYLWSYNKLEYAEAALNLALEHLRIVKTPKVEVDVEFAF